MKNDENRTKTLKLFLFLLCRVCTVIIVSVIFDLVVSKLMFLSSTQLCPYVLCIYFDIPLSMILCFYDPMSTGNNYIVN